MSADRDELSARLWALADVGTPMAVRVAATLCLADHIAAGHRTAARLAEMTATNADALERMLRYLAARGVFSQEDGQYALTPLGEVLRDDHPAGLRGWLDIEGTGRAELSFAGLLHSIRTGEAAFTRQFGRPFWEDLAADPARAAAFNGLIGSDVVRRADAIVAAYDWGSLGHVVDVGGGNGALLISMLRAFPGLRGTVVELPGTADTAWASLAAAGLAGRGEVVAASFFDPLPPGAGGYVLSLVLHDWADREAQAILRRCAEAAGAPGGSVFVIESLSPDGTVHTGMDLLMLTALGGRERTADELGRLAGGAGLSQVGEHAAGGSSIVELRPARPAPPNGGRGRESSR
jgi:hypothetical protein